MERDLRAAGITPALHPSVDARVPSVATRDAGRAAPLIRMEKIRRVYQLGEIEVPVLHGVSLTIERGEMVALIGASGSGKTTLMNVIGCLDRATSGRYWLDGEEVSQLTADERARIRNAKIGFVFQNFSLLPRTSALEQVMLPLEYVAAPPDPREARRRATEILARVGLKGRLDHFSGQLSGGEQQRVAIARALVNHPSLLLADEPTGNLDSRTSLAILDMFQELHASEGITILLVTHDASVAEHAQRTILIRDGCIAGRDEAVSAAPDLGTTNAGRARGPGA
jgi:ABC-type lipoprotein export system ATPase subunit